MKRLLYKIYEKRWGYFFILPAYLFFLLFYIYPVYDNLRLSLYETGLVTEVFVGLDNYVRLFNDTVFFTAIRNTLIFVLGVVPTTIVVATFVSVVIFPLGKKIHTAVRFVYYLPVVAGAVVLSLVWNYIYHPTFGLLNYFLMMLGFSRVAWLSDPHWALPALILVVITWTLGQPIILLLAGLGGISDQLWDAADIDGANRWQKFWYVTLPLLKPTILFVLITQTIAVFQVFVVVQILTLGGPGNRTQTIVYRIWETSFRYYDMGYAAAMSVILLIMVTIIGIFQFKFLGGEIDF